MITAKNVKGTPGNGSCDSLNGFAGSSVCAEYEAIEQRALAKPATTAELNDIIKYIDNAKGDKSLQLTRRIKVRFVTVDAKHSERLLHPGGATADGIPARRVFLLGRGHSIKCQYSSLAEKHRPDLRYQR
jgi:hypothetical protein